MFAGCSHPSQLGTSVVSEVQRARERYRKQKEQARAAAIEKLVPLVGERFQLMEWSNRAFERQEEQWGRAHFPWQDIRRRFRDVGQMDLACWTGEERLAFLAVATVSNRQITFKFMEADPRSDCPLKGRRLLIALEAIANYGQLRGKRQIILEPANESLVGLYTQTYGFVCETQPNGKKLCRKEL